MEPRHSTPDSSNLVYFTGVKQDFNAHRILFEKTVRLEEVQLATHRLTLNIFAIPKKYLNILQATTSSFPLLKINNSTLNQMKA